MALTTSAIAISASTCEAGDALGEGVGCSGAERQREVHLQPRVRHEGGHHVERAKGREVEPSVEREQRLKGRCAHTTRDAPLWPALRMCTP